ncbi:MAG TPA: hypothetical protein VM553_00680, partial [Dongiaceae bacterium]|nr:hypothetical protein [Dongiaceae bacterium]
QYGNTGVTDEFRKLAVGKAEQSPGHIAVSDISPVHYLSSIGFLFFVDSERGDVSSAGLIGHVTTCIVNL